MSKNMVGMLITTSQNPKSSQQIVAFVQPMMPNPKPYQRLELENVWHSKLGVYQLSK